MRKYIIITALLVLAVSGFSAYTDTLTLTIYSKTGQAVVESIFVTIDTATVSSEYDTFYTDANGQCFIALPNDEIYKIRMYKSGVFYKDSLLFSWTAIDTAGGKDSVNVGLSYFLTPVKANYCINAHQNTDSDTIHSPAESVYVDIINANGDTLVSGYTDSLGNLPIDPDTLTAAQTYWAYLTDADSVFVNDYIVWVHSANTDKVLSVEMDSLATVTGLTR